MDVWTPLSGVLAVSSFLLVPAIDWRLGFLRSVSVTRGGAASNSPPLRLL